MFLLFNIVDSKNALAFFQLIGSITENANTTWLSCITFVIARCASFWIIAISPFTPMRFKPRLCAVLQPPQRTARNRTYRPYREEPYWPQSKRKPVIVQTSSACRNLLLIQQLNKQQILGMRSLSALLPANLPQRSVDKPQPSNTRNIRRTPNNRGLNRVNVKVCSCALRTECLTTLGHRAS